MQNEDYLYFSRRARDEDHAARLAQTMEVRRVHQEFAAAYRARCQDVLRVDEPAPRSGRFHQSTASGLTLFPPLERRMRYSVTA